MESESEGVAGRERGVRRTIIIGYKVAAPKPTQLLQQQCVPYEENEEDEEKKASIHSCIIISMNH